MQQKIVWQKLSSCKMNIWEINRNPDLRPYGLSSFLSFLSCGIPEAMLRHPGPSRILSPGAPRNPLVHLCSVGGHTWQGLSWVASESHGPGGIELCGRGGPPVCVWPLHQASPTAWVEKHILCERQTLAFCSGSPPGGPTRTLCQHREPGCTSALEPCLHVLGVPRRLTESKSHVLRTVSGPSRCSSLRDGTSEWGFGIGGWQGRAE